MADITSNTDLTPKKTRVFGGDDLLIGGAMLAGSILANRYTQKKQQEAIDKQNAYNTPAEQMKRFNAAGLNTALLYGQVSDGNQAQPTGVPDYGQGVGNAFDKALTKSAQQLEMMKIDNDKQRVAMEKKMNDVNVALAGTQIETNKENLKIIAKSALKLDADTALVKQQYQQNEKKFDKELASLDKDNLLKDWQISCAWMDFEQKKFAFEKLMPWQEKYLKGQATYEEVVGNMANELVDAEIFSKRKSDVQQWLVSTFGKDFESLIRENWKVIKGKLKNVFGDSPTVADWVSDRVSAVNHKWQETKPSITAGWQMFKQNPFMWSVYHTFGH